MAEANSYKALLEKQLSEITAELETLGVPNPRVPEDWIATPEGVAISEADPNVGADRAEEWDERRSTLAELETRFNNLVRALDKINNKTFGVCEICETNIETDRLDVNPAARTCKTHINDEARLTI